MPKARVNGVNLFYEEVGRGTPLLFVHEFAGDYRSWRPQVEFFARRYRTITFNARGYPPSDVPEESSAYSQQHAVDDMKGLLDHLAIGKAHICGLSMGGYATLHKGWAEFHAQFAAHSTRGVQLARPSLEEPGIFNRALSDFLMAVDAGRWTRRGVATA